MGCDRTRFVRYLDLNTNHLTKYGAMGIISVVTELVAGRPKNSSSLLAQAANLSFLTAFRIELFPSSHLQFSDGEFYPGLGQL